MCREQKGDTNSGLVKNRCKIGECVLKQATGYLSLKLVISTLVMSFGHYKLN